MYHGVFWLEDRIFFEANMIFGMVGLKTAMKRQSYALSYHSREPSDGDSCFAMALHLRDIFEKCDNYDCAVDMASSPMSIDFNSYIVISGVKEY
jgi:hypothetical protein